MGCKQLLQKNMTLISLETVTSAINISANGDDLLLSLPLLTSAFHASFRNVSELSIPALATVNGSPLLQGNNIDTFSAAALKAVESNLGFSSNSYLVNISLPALTTIGGNVTLYDNENLTSVSFAELETVEGAVNMSGTYTG